MQQSYGKELGHELIKNVPDNERVITGIGGALLGLMSLRHGGITGLLGLAAGGALVARAVTGHCPAYERLGMDDQERQLADRQGWQSAAVTRETITINRPREQIYSFWRNVSNLSKVMSHVERIDLLDSKRSHWVVALPFGKSIEFDSQVTEDRPNERIAWRADEHADLRNSGWVEFREAPGGRGTDVIVQLSYEPPGGEIGRMAARAWPNSPGALLKNDLRQLKQKIESGELGLTGGGSGSASVSGGGGQLGLGDQRH
jgi:uncharacterized membrane protein